MSQYTRGPWRSNGTSINAGSRWIGIASPNPKANDGSMPANARLMALSTVIPDLYASEINAKVEWFWDGGYDVAIGDGMNGWCAAENIDHWEDALEWLEKTACDLFPDSTFAKARAA